MEVEVAVRTPEATTRHVRTAFHIPTAVFSDFNPPTNPKQLKHNSTQTQSLKFFKFLPALSLFTRLTYEEFTLLDIG